MFSVPLASMKGFGKITQTANTVITRLIPPIPNTYARLTDLWYTCGTTAHTLTIMTPLGYTTVSSAAAAAQQVINITADPGLYSAYGTFNTADNAIAASDFCAYQTKDGIWILDTVSSVSTLAITMTSNVPTSTVAKGASFFFFGVVGDTNPATGLVHPAFNMPASVTTYFGTDMGEGIAGFIGSYPGLDGSPAGSSLTAKWPLTGVGEPIVIHSNNATAAGTIEKTTVCYANR